MKRKALRRCLKISLSILIMFISAFILHSEDHGKSISGEDQPEVFNLIYGEKITLEIKTGFPVRWEASTDGVSWESIKGETRNSIEIMAISDRYYRAVSQAVNCDPVVSQVTFINVKNPLPDSVPKSIGMLKPIWRNGPVLGPHLHWGLWLNEVPVYFFQTDFPYLKRPYEQEVLFADHLSIVRLLGGTLSFPGLDLSNDLGPNNKLDETDTVAIEKLSQYDFAYRKPDGTLAFRPELIDDRLGPYIENGYESLTIVLDNVPYDLTSHPEIGPYGQSAPPDDPDEWYETVRQLCVKLSDMLGSEKANKLRFRIGTEMNHTHRFAGTEEQYITHFDYAAAAIKDVLPGAIASPFNIMAPSIEDITSSHNVNAYKVIEHASTGTNRKTGEPNVPVSFVAASRYYRESFDLNDIINKLDEAWDYISDNIPGNENFTREIHEYSALDTRFGLKTSNPDAFGNAMNLQVLISLLDKGVDRVFHWNMLERIPWTSMSIPSSILWGYSVLEYMQGGTTSIIKPSCSHAHENTTFSGMISVFDDKAYLLINSFNKDRTIHKMNEVTVRIPKDLLPFGMGKMQSASMNNDNCIYQSIRENLDLAGNLKPEVKEKEEWTSELSRMSTNVNIGREMVKDNWSYYISNWKKALTLDEFSGSLRENDEDYYITLDISSPESTIILLEASDPVNP
jgi:hypothetical protein